MEGLNLLTRPKSQLGRSIFFFCRVEAFASKDWQRHCFCRNATRAEAVNERQLFGWLRNCCALNVRWHSANPPLLGARALPASGLGGASFEAQRGRPGKAEKGACDSSVFLRSLLHYLCFLLLNPHPTAPTKSIRLLSEPQSITLPQPGTIRLILARVAPNLAASEQWE